MHVRWRGLELPARVVADPVTLTRTFGSFTIEPFERGFGTTVGNSLRRILLSSLQGSAVTSVKIEGVEHEFSTIPGVMEDVTDIILNVKNLVVSLEGDDQKTMRLAATGPGEVTADLIEADTAVTIHNPELTLCSLTDEVDFEIELTVSKGRGYVPASEQYETPEEQIIGEIPIDAIYSPVQRVRYKTEDTRVGQKTNYDRLILEIWTNGTVSPEMALVEAAKILRKHLNPFVQYFELGDDTITAEARAAAGVDEQLIRKLNMRIEDLDLSVRATNCLASGGVHTVADLVSRPESELLTYRSFGKTSLREVHKKLEELNLTLGMKLPEGYQNTSKAPA
ncbi:MAG: DNA-directed RNA polymerase subunit alpha [Phycisphaerales bacterium]